MVGTRYVGLFIATLLLQYYRVYDVAYELTLLIVICSLCGEHWHEHRTLLQFLKHFFVVYTYIEETLGSIELKNEQKQIPSNNFSP